MDRQTGLRGLVNKNSPSASAKGRFDETAIHLVSLCVGFIKSRPLFSSLSSVFQEGFAFKSHCSGGATALLVHYSSQHDHLLFQKHLGSEWGVRKVAWRHNGLELFWFYPFIFYKYLFRLRFSSGDN